MARSNIIEAELPLAGAGVNLLTDPLALGDAELQLSANAFPTVPGKLMKRPAIRPTAFPALAGTGLCVAAFAGPASEKYDLITARVPYGANETQLEVWMGGQLAANAMGASYSAFREPGTRPCIFEVNGHVIVLPNAGTAAYPGFVALVPPKTTLSAFNVSDYYWASWDFKAGSNGEFPTRTQATPIYPRVGCGYRGSAVYGNLGVGFEKYILYADWGSNFPVGYAKGTVGYYPQYGMVFNDALSVNGGVLKLNGGKGSRIVGMTEVALSQSGALMETAVLVLSERDAWLCTGHPLNSWDPNTGNNPLYGDWKPNLLSYEVGCAAYETIVRTPYGTIWASDDDVWMMMTGGLPMRIGTKIRPRLQSAPPNFQSFWYGVYDPCGVYRLGIATDDSYSMDVGGTTYEVPVYDEWWLDLRGGPPRNSDEASWWGPQKMRPVADKAANYSRMSPAFVSQRPGQRRRVMHVVESTGMTIDSGGIPQPRNKTLLTGLSQCIGDSTIEESADSKVDCAAPLATAARKWQPSTDYSTGDIVRPMGEFKGLWYICIASTSPNTSRATEPAWPGLAGSVLDGGSGGLYTMTWWEVGEYMMTPNQLGAWDGATVGTNQCEVTVDVRTKEMSYGDVASGKTMLKTKISAAAHPGQKLGVNFIQEVGSFSELSNVNVNNPLATAESGNLGQSTVLGSGVIQTALGPALSGRLVHRAFHAHENTRIKYDSATLQLIDYTGFTIDDTNNKLFVALMDKTLWSSPYTTKVCRGGWLITIPRGFYASMKDLVTQLQISSMPMAADGTETLVNEVALTNGVKVIDKAGIIASKPWGPAAFPAISGYNGNSASSTVSGYIPLILLGATVQDFSTSSYVLGLAKDTRDGLLYVSAADQVIVSNLMSLLGYPSDEEAYPGAVAPTICAVYHQHRSITNPSQLTLQQAVVRVEVLGNPVFGSKQTL